MFALPLALSLASAATFTVDSGADSWDGLPGDGVCVDASGVCTLRAAVMEANALPGPDVIEINVGQVTFSLPGRGEDLATRGDLDVTDDLTVTPAPGLFQPTIFAASLDRIWHVQQHVSLTLISLRLTGGQAYDSVAPASYGGAILVESIIDPATALPTWPLLVVQSTSITSNFVTGSVNTFGGGIAAIGGDVYLTGAELHVNGVHGYGGGVYTNGGALLDATKSAFTSNRARYGGGLSTSGSTNLWITTIQNNTATAMGGGMYSSSDAFWLDHSVLYNNRSTNFGGGLFAAGALGSLSNSTVSSNQSGRGGGVASRTSVLDFLHATIHRNRALTAPSSGGVWADSASTLTSANTVIARNNGGTNADCEATFISSGGNFLGFVGTTPVCLGFVAGPDQVGTGVPLNPGLSAIGAWGGPTFTHAPLAWSPLIDNADASWCTADDQRFFARPVGAGCDVGAQEGP